MNGSLLVIVVGTVVFNVLGQMLLKIGSGRPGLSDMLPLSLVNPYTAGGALCFASALGFYVLALQRLPLIVAQALFSLQFAVVILAAMLVLGERMTLMQGLGIVMIATGVFLTVRV